MSEVVMQQPTMPERMRTDEGIGRVGAILAAGALAVTAVVGAAVLDKLPSFPKLPGYTAAPEDSNVKIRQLKLDRRDNHCLTLGAWDAAGTVMALKVDTEAGQEVTGKRVVVHSLKPVDETCVSAADVVIEEIEKDGLVYKLVSIDKDDFVRDVKHRPEDTLLEVEQGGVEDVIDSVRSGATGVSRLGCQAINYLREDDLDCDSLRRFVQADNLSQEKLKQATVAEVKDTVRVEGGQASFPKIKEYYGDYYKDQAAAEGIDRNRVIFEVTDDGKPTDELPGFDRTIEDELIEEGFLAEDVELAQQLEYEEKIIIPIPSEEDARKQ